MIWDIHYRQCDGINADTNSGPMEEVSSDFHPRSCKKVNLLRMSSIFGFCSSISIAGGDYLQ